MPETDTALGASPPPSGADQSTASNEPGGELSYEQLFAALTSPAQSEVSASDPAATGDTSDTLPPSSGQRPSEAVPYDRFAEVNRQAKEAQEELSRLRAALGENDPTQAQTILERAQRFEAILSQLESEGYRTAAEVQEALQRQQQEAEIARFEQERAEHYRERIETDGMDPDTATIALERDRLQRQFEILQRQMVNENIHRQKESAFALYPAARPGEAFVDALIANGTPPNAAAEQVAKMLSSLQSAAQNAIAARAPAAPVPMGGRDQTPMTPTNPTRPSTREQVLGNISRSWEDIFGLTKGKDKL